MTRSIGPRSDPDLERIAAPERSCRTRSVSANYADPISQHKRVSRYLSCTHGPNHSRRVVWPVFVKHERDRDVRIQVVSEASLVNVRIKGTKVVGRRSKKQVPCLFGRGVRRNPYPYRDNLHPLRTVRLRFASGSGLAAGRDEMHGVTTPARPGKGSHG